MQLLTAFKSLLFDNPLLIEAVNTLPKYRVAEINKLAEEKAGMKPELAVPHKSPRVRPISGKEESKIPKDDIIGSIRMLLSIQINTVNAEAMMQAWD